MSVQNILETSVHTSMFQSETKKQAKEKEKLSECFAKIFGTIKQDQIKVANQHVKTFQGFFYPESSKLVSDQKPFPLDQLLESKPYAS